MSTTKKELAEKIKRRLGYPMIKVELHPRQIDDAIDYARDKFIKWAVGQATQETWFTVLLSAGQNFYDLPVGVTKPGGRLEADVVGARIWKDKLEIRHIETGTLSQGVQGANSIAGKKFSAYVSRSISKYFKQKFSFKGGVEYEKIYVPTYSSKPTVRELQRLGIEVIKLPDLIREKVAETIQEWKRNPPDHPQITGKSVTLPESYWLLQMLDYLKFHNMLK